LLRAFVTVARLQTVAAAAQALHLTQGAVSKQIKELEDWLRLPLFERVRKRLQLTPAGRATWRRSSHCSLGWRRSRWI